MLCDVCHKNEATVHLTQIVEDQMKTVDLCEACSKAKGVDDPTGFSLASLLLGAGLSTEPAAAAPAVSTEPKCPRCGFTVSDFKKSGRLGCAQCYTVFAEPLNGLLKSMHKGTRHTGKVPRGLHQGLDLQERLKSLQSRLAEAVAAEQFEQAAVLRDQIKQLKAKSESASPD